MEKMEKKQLSKEQIKSLQKYPDYWQDALRTTMLRLGVSADEAYEELKDLEGFM